MIIREIEHNIELPEPDHPRSEGVHLSAIIRSCAARYGILKAEWVEDLSLCDSHTITDKGSKLRIMIGLAWEALFSQTLPEVTYHPGEVELEGVYMTPDGESVDVVTTQQANSRQVTRWAVLVHEFKTTYKSTKTVGDLKSQWMWLTQIKGYCKALKTRYAKVYVLFICGNYQFPITPDFRVWEVEFTQEEIDESWERLMEYKEKQLTLDLEAARAEL